jgi:predicted RNA-binding Zn-ribbon protein involved in translation (DUF1610 family)
MYGKPESGPTPTRDDLDDEDRKILNAARDVLMRLFDGYNSESYSIVGDAVLTLMGLDSEAEMYSIDECCSSSVYVLKRDEAYVKEKCPNCKGSGEVGKFQQVE